MKTLNHSKFFGFIAVLVFCFGLVGIAHATPNPDPTHIVKAGQPIGGTPAVGGETEIWVYPIGSPDMTTYTNPHDGNATTPDIFHIQWAIDHVSSTTNGDLVDGTVVLKHVPGTPFQFHPPSAPINFGSFQVYIKISGTVKGETDGIPTNQFPNGTPLTTIREGVVNFGLNRASPNNDLRKITLQNLVGKDTRGAFAASYGNSKSLIQNIKLDGILPLFSTGGFLIPFFSHNWNSWTVKYCNIDAPFPTGHPINYGIAYEGFGASSIVTIAKNTINTISGTGIGILNNSGSAMVSDNTTTSAIYGIEISNASDNLIFKNTLNMTNTALAGVVLSGSDRSVVKATKINGSVYEAGVALENSNENVLIGINSATLDTPLTYYLRSDTSSNIIKGYTGGLNSIVDETNSAPPPGYNGDNLLTGVTPMTGSGVGQLVSELSPSDWQW